MRKTFIADIVVALFILLFVYAASSKLVDYQKFRVQLAQSPLLTSISGLVAWFVPAVEILIAMALLFDRFRLVALYACFTMMVMFSAYIIAITRFSEFIPCSCGGILQNLHWDQHLIFNLIFSLLAIVGIMTYPDNIVLSSKDTKNDPSLV